MQVKVFDQRIIRRAVGLSLWLSVASYAATAATLNVTNYGALTNPTAAIQKAVSLAAPGDTIYFPNGTYSITSPIVPKSKLTLTGQSQSGAILRMVGQGTVFDLSGLSGVEVSYLTLDGNTNVFLGRGIYATTGSGFNLHHLAIKNMVNTNDYGPFAIHFNGAVTNSVVADNLITNIGTNSMWGGAIRCSWGASGNQILRNTISITGRGGIFADNGSSDLVIQSNNISRSGLNSTGLGIELWGGCGRSVVEDNVIDHWLSVSGASGSSIRRNTVRDLSENMIAWAGLELVASTNVIFTDNVVDHGQWIGISISNDDIKNYIFWAYNTIQSMAQWGVQLQGDLNGARYQYFYKNKFINTVKNHLNAPYPSSSGNGFRFNGSAYSIMLDSNQFSGNQGVGIEFSGNIDQISVINNTITNDSYAAVNSYPSTAVDLEWANNIVNNTSVFGVPVSRGFADAKPVANFTCPVQVGAGETVAFINTSTDSDGTLAHVLWDFGAGVPSSVLSPTFAYARPGTYRVSLIVWDNAGRSGRKETTIAVVPPSLRVSQTNNAVQLSWPSWASNFALCSATILNSNTTWSACTNPPRLINTNWTLNLPPTNLSRYFRLIGH